MKRSAAVAIGLVQAVAAAALSAGCGSRHGGAEQSWENCVDQQGQVVDDQQCHQEQPQWSRPGYRPYYHWYYTRGGQPLGIGHPAFGGSLVRPAAGVSVSHGSSSGHSVSRGGFGSIGSGHGAAA